MTTQTNEREITTTVMSVSAAQTPRLTRLDDYLRLAEVLGPIAGGAAHCLLKLLAGAELGFGPFAAIQGIDVIEGKAVVGAHLKAAAIKQSDRYDYHIVEQDEAGTVCEVAFFERVSHTGGLARKFSQGWERKGSVRMTIALANEKGLTRGRSGVKTNWATAPADMLFARCISKGQKRYCPDLQGGARTYDADELDAEVIEVAPAPAPAPLPVSGATAGEVSVAVAGPVTTEQVDRIASHVERLGLDWSKINNRLYEKYKVWLVRQLNSAQADEVEAALSAKASKPAAA